MDVSEQIRDLLREIRDNQREQIEHFREFNTTLAEWTKGSIKETRRNSWLYRVVIVFVVVLLWVYAIKSYLQ